MAGNLAVARDMKMNKHDHCPTTDIYSYNYQDIYNSSDSFTTFFVSVLQNSQRMCTCLYV